MLYPYENPCRSTSLLNGLWHFALGKEEDIQNERFREPLQETQFMPVPASFNDIGVTREFRNHVGIVWYERFFFKPKAVATDKVFIRFGAVTHKATVYMNGQKIGEHSGGYTPFEFEVSELLLDGEQNRLTLAVDNRLDFTTIPVGEVLHERGVARQEYYFDFFNYSGIHRNVHLYTVDKLYIEDLDISSSTDYENKSVEISYKVKTEANKLNIDVFDKEGNRVFQQESAETQGSFSLNDITLWQVHKGYRYHIRFSIIDNKKLIDNYTLPYGFRDIKVQNEAILLNGEAVYLKGFGKHEDSPINGRGYNEVYNVKDFQLMKHLGANSLRTAHYPYSEEFLELADQEGFLVISETAAVGLDLRIVFAQMSNKDGTGRNTWDTMKCNQAHEQAIVELITRDKHRPSVIMYSLANEPASQEEGAFEYFQPLVALAKKLDSSRPITIVQHIDSNVETSKINELVDVLAINRYWGWYDKPGNLDSIEADFAEELELYNTKYKKPILLSEYGADSIEGHSSLTKEMWTEDFQLEIIQRYNAVLDRYPFCVGEHIWNFADFMTKEGIIRVKGNKKGVMTRDRQAKRAFYYLKERWATLS